MLLESLLFVSDLCHELNIFLLWKYMRNSILEFLAGLGYPILCRTIHFGFVTTISEAFERGERKMNFDLLNHLKE